MQLFISCINTNIHRRGDHHRYIADLEISEGEERTQLAETSLASFKKALEIASEHGVQTLHPARLAVILNCSSLLFETLHRPQEAEKMIEEVHTHRQACNNAI